MRNALPAMIIGLGLSFAGFAQTRIISHVTAPGGGFTTTVIIENRDVLINSITLTPYDRDGNALPAYTAELGGQSATAVSADQLFPGEAAVSHFQVEAGPMVDVSVDYDFMSGNGSPAQVRNTTEVARSWRIFPGNWDLVFDGLAVVNMGSAPADIVITQNDLAGNELRTETIATGLAANAKALYVIGSPNGSVFENPGNSYFEIKSSQPSAMTALRGTLGNAAIGLLWANETLALDGIATGDRTTRMISHVTADGGGFTTSVILENHSAAEQSLTIRPFNRDGGLLIPVTRTLAPNEVQTQTVAALLGVGISHFEIESDPSVKASVNYDFGSGNGSPAHVRATADQAVIWRVFPGDWDLVFDGLAVVNTGDQLTELWITQRDFQGEILRTERIQKELAPNAKALYVIGSPNGSPFSRDTPSYFEVTADRPLAITALRGTLGNAETGLLWSNEDLGVSRSATLRDEKGVWLIKGGSSLYEVYEMMAYNVAVDRLYQSDIFRRRSAGRFAEWFGPTVLNLDVLWRTILYSPEEYEAIYDGMDEDSKILYKAYLDGMNRRISQVNALEDPTRPGFDQSESLMPIEYRILQATSVEPWDMASLLANTSAVQINFTVGFSLGMAQVENLALLQDLTEKFGAEQAGIMFEDLRWVNDPQAPTVIPGSGHTTGGASKTRTKTKPPVLREGIPDIRGQVTRLNEDFRQMERELKIRGAHIKSGSYAWAVSGSKTQSGNPILYAGPQMSFIAPAICLEGSIESDVLNVSGMLIPGVPAMIIGRTPHHAWSLQVGHTPSWDYYLVDDADKVLQRTDLITIAGGGFQPLEIYRSKQDPVLSGTDLGWKYANRGYEFNIGGGIVKMARAQSMEEFGEGVAALGIGQHILYADKDGNIAHWMSGRNPVRPEGEYRLPQGAVAEPIDYDTSNAHPPPHAANPDQGFLGGWNNKAAPDCDDPLSVWAFGPFHRSHVIEDYLRANDNLTYEEVRDLAQHVAMTDSFHIPGNNLGFGGNTWQFIGEYFKDAVNNDPTDSRNEALALLESWNGYFLNSPDELVTGLDRSDAWMLLETWVQKVLDLTFDDELGERLFELERFEVLLHGLDPEAVLKNRYDWFQNATNSSAPQTAQAIIVQGLDDALAELGQRPWGINQRGEIIHAINFPVAIPATPFSNRSTYAQCVELGSDGPVRIETIHPLGQSGQATLNFGAGTPVFDEHNFDLHELYNNFELRPFTLFDK